LLHHSRIAPPCIGAARLLKREMIPISITRTVFMTSRFRPGLLMASHTLGYRHTGRLEKLVFTVIGWAPAVEPAPPKNERVNVQSLSAEAVH